MKEKISLHPYTSIVKLGQQDLSFDAVASDFEALRPTMLKSENDDLGFTDGHFWTKTQLHNKTDSEFHYYLETARPVTDLVELYVLDSDSRRVEKHVSGDAMPYAQRSFDDRRTVFRIDIPPHARLDLFLHLKSDGEVIKIPLILRDAQSFVKITVMEQWIFGIFYGILLTAAIIYLFFFFALRERTFLYYSLYVVFIGLMQFALDGYFYQLITPGGGWFSRHAVLIFAMIAGFLLGRYSEVFLGIRKHNKTIGRIFDGLYVPALVLILVLIFVPSAFAICYPLANVLGLLILVNIISAVVYLYWKKIHVDIFFSIGILFLILGFGNFIGNNFGQIPNSFFVLNSSKFGTGLEIIFL